MGEAVTAGAAAAVVCGRSAGTEKLWSDADTGAGAGKRDGDWKGLAWKVGGRCNDEWMVAGKGTSGGEERGVVGEDEESLLLF